MALSLNSPVSILINYVLLLKVRFWRFWQILMKADRSREILFVFLKKNFFDLSLVERGESVTQRNKHWLSDLTKRGYRFEWLDREEKCISSDPWGDFQSKFFDFYRKGTKDFWIQSPPKAGGESQKRHFFGWRFCVVCFEVYVRGLVMSIEFCIHLQIKHCVWFGLVWFCLDFQLASVMQ